MKNLLLKRLDSSFTAFNKTLNRFVDNSKIVLKMFENDQIIIAPKVNLEEYLLDDEVEETFRDSKRQGSHC